MTQKTIPFENDVIGCKQEIHQFLPLSNETICDATFTLSFILTAQFLVAEVLYRIPFTLKGVMS
jgi:hypothetical protein